MSEHDHAWVYHGLINGAHRLDCPCGISFFIDDVILWVPLT